MYLNMYIIEMARITGFTGEGMLKLTGSRRLSWHQEEAGNDDADEG